jgi:predicted nuclease of predicted toxin-antitoxin system
MSLRLFTDHCVPNSIIRRLIEDGHEVFRLRDHIPTDSPDAVVLRTAQDLDAILISLDGDFSDIVSYPPSQYKGIIALQVRNRPEAIPAIMDGLRKFISGHLDGGEYIGKLLLVESHRIRIR